MVRRVWCARRGRRWRRSRVGLLTEPRQHRGVIAVVRTVLPPNPSFQGPSMDPPLQRFRWILINSSAGKDSQAMLDVVVEKADRARVPRERLVVVHADLGRGEWPR